ncbi:di-heme oxidoredictase family protein [Candidatus Pelagisphaera phototrophica]|uniref:di-heme oxidoreductase family protein n=1 Tax=Candidatus Pelagisphaera phototrophica TaxID=2684113 RepID=UPI0024B75C24|nr:di-heme oxidoredictase family protein [Candidatus Pelagisphaera phototrophica]
MRADSMRCLIAATLITILVHADYRLPGGATTVFETSREAFTQPLENLAPRSLAKFFSGDTLFNTNWVNASSVVTSRDGLGPLFNMRSCSACHFKDGRGSPPAAGEIPNGLLVRISATGDQANGAPFPHPVYGNQLSVRSLPGTKPEAEVLVSYKEIVGSYPDGSKFRIQKPNYSFKEPGYGPLDDFHYSPRVAPSVFGLGLLGSIPDEILLRQSDPNDADNDGISGRPNWVWSASQTAKSLGKFGWKANKANLLDQTAAAFQGDIGITSDLFPSENHTDQQTELADSPSGGNPEIDELDLEDVVFYLQSLAPPASRFETEADYKKGYELFTETKCTSCHTPEFKTAKQALIPALSGLTIHPYTDLLLHDMGNGLADNRPDFEATGNEWRTPPLWGIGLIPKVNGHTRLLHDGRARNIEEAILWHGGEGEESKQLFTLLNEQARADLIQFVESL